MKPFLLLQTRPETATADNEYAAFAQYGGLRPEELVRVRLDQESLGQVTLDDYSGIIMGGGPYNVSDDQDKKKPDQLRAEAEVAALLDIVIAQDFPLLGACYGIGTIGTHQGGLISKKYHEAVGPTSIHLTQEGAADPLLQGVALEFTAFVGHKEACEELPPSATLLATSDNCPVQMFRVKKNIYATQFHPELDGHGLEVRINIYKNYGYFPPEAATELIKKGHAADVTEPEKILRNFIQAYAKLPAL